jgi:hypothetical protein
MESEGNDTIPEIGEDLTCSEAFKVRSMHDTPFQTNLSKKPFAALAIESVVYS